jgi:prepilin-type N-terminal cleavage/methylation domain-containing protein/prepilin-type processing-associated H-X9-DG protein
MKRPNRGFTLIELLVVIAIIAILAAILFPVFARAREAARATTCRSNLKQVSTAMMMYVQDYDETMINGPTSGEGGLCGTGGIHGVQLGTWSGGIPMYGFWNARALPYIKNEQVFRCPSESNPHRWSPCNNGPIANGAYYWGDYGLNQYAYDQSLAVFASPATTAMVVEARAQYNRQNCNQPTGHCCGGETYQGMQVPRVRHSETHNVAFMDGHVKALKPKVADSSYHFHTTYHPPPGT